MTDAPSRKQDQFIVRLPDGMRDRIKYAAEANGRSMNAEIVAALYDWFPDPTAEEYLAWLHRELIFQKELLNNPKAKEELRKAVENRIAEIRQDIIDVIDGKSSPATFQERIAAMSDHHAVKR
ncbi:Arc family DNA-binding protein [Paracoccus mangrovi]|uniref:Arc family DNA-binding protein n=1 Tax=Paracoccus mangrovi TaxID=1715645 RepID=A0ABV7R5I0_9RHOB